jgi:hypothetical protein
MSTLPTLQTADITPSPRILWVLGQIPFRPWQALAELIDNSLDAFLAAERDGELSDNARIDVNWSNSNVAADKRVIEISDNGRGIDLETVTLAVRAGYTSNDPVGNLGLFGMGFNIATARLGGVTRFLSTRTTSSEWAGIEIDFRDLAKRGSFSAPIVKEVKPDHSLTGTKVVISDLNEGNFKELRDRETELRKTLEDVYAPILRDKKVAIYVNGQRLSPRPYCIWNSERSVARDGAKVSAVLKIDRDLGSALFDVERNQYIPGASEAELRAKLANGIEFPDNIVERHRKLRGWIGVQRYADPNDFGIDFVRNGRKILIKDKRLFSWENPLSGEVVLEYPVELGSTVGGRLVGEVHVDYLVPTYQKNDFDRSESSWVETVLALRGDGPFLPKRRKAMGYSDAVTSPIGLLANVYRRSDPGTRCLAAPNSSAREWAKLFLKGDSTYQSDEKWWKAAQEADQAKVDKGGDSAAPVDPGDQPTDDIDIYAPPPSKEPGGQLSPVPKPTTAQPPVQKDSNVDTLTQSSTLVEWLSGEYGYGKSAALKIRAYAFNGPGRIIKDGKNVPCLLFQDANECDFFFDKGHPIVAEYPLAPQDLLTVYLAERFKARDHLPDLVETFSLIYSSKFKDTRVERGVLQDRAYNIIEDLRFRFEEYLNPVAGDVLQVIHESAGDVEETTISLFDDTDLLELFLHKDPMAIKVIGFIPERTLPRLLERFPEHLLDKKVFSLPFMQISLSDERATSRARTESRRRIQSYLEDVVSLVTSKLTKASKDELKRASLSLALLQDCIVQ